MLIMIAENSDCTVRPPYNRNMYFYIAPIIKWLKWRLKAPELCSCYLIKVKPQDVYFHIHVVDYQTISIQTSKSSLNYSHWLLEIYNAC